jgi:CheY-like chemotaxis protein
MLQLRRATILLVEDDPDDEALTLRALRKGNLVHQIVVTRNGQETLDYLFATSREAAGKTKVMPELVLLDLKLPMVDGHEVLRQIRTNPRTRHLPVVILSSSKSEEDKERSYELGANSYVYKPVNYLQFAEATHQLVLYWLAVNEPLLRG